MIPVGQWTRDNMHLPLHEVYPAMKMVFHVHQGPVLLCDNCVPQMTCNICRSYKEANRACVACRDYNLNMGAFAQGCRVDAMKNTMGNEGNVGVGGNDDNPNHDSI
jgi:hypothetical protein